MTLAELVTAYQAGIATQETFVWTEGMADWKPLAEVETVVAALNLASRGDAADAARASHAPAAAHSPDDAATGVSPKEAPAPYRQTEATAPVAYAGLETASPVAHRQPEAAAQVAHRQPDAAAPVASYRQPEPTAPLGHRPAEAAPLVAQGREAVGPVQVPDATSPQPAEARRASVVKRENRGRDIFAESPEYHPLDEKPVPQVPAPYAGDVVKATGQRNENSVLFSLAMLTKTGEERAPHAEASATSEDSGMIDLKALAEKAASMRPAADGALRAPALSTKAEVYIPPLAVSPTFGSYMGANPAKPPRSRTLAIVGGGVGVVALVVFGVFLGTQLGASTSAPAIASAASSAEAPDAADAASAASPSASDTTAETSPSAAPSASAVPSARAAGGWHPPPGGWPARPAGGGAGGKPAGGGGAAGGGGGAAAGGAASGGAAPPPPPPKKTSDCGCNGDLMCLMKCSASGH